MNKRQRKKRSKKLGFTPFGIDIKMDEDSLREQIMLHLKTAPSTYWDTVFAPLKIKFNNNNEKEEKFK